MEKTQVQSFVRSFSPREPLECTVRGEFLHLDRKTGTVCLVIPADAHGTAQYVWVSADTVRAGRPNG